MSVIAKARIASITDLGTHRVVTFNLVCENDLMAQYAGSEEDRLFTRYSPWGEITIHQSGESSLGQQGDTFYFMVLSTAETNEAGLDAACAYTAARCASITDFGDNMAKTVEFADRQSDKRRQGIDRLMWKMSVDNPPATAQFRAGHDGYFVALYRAASLDRDGAIKAAHGA